MMQIKKNLAILAGLMLVVCLWITVAYAALNTYDGVTYTSIYNPTRVTGTTTGTSVDVQAMQGIATIIISATHSEAQTPWTNTVVIQDSADDSTFTPATNLANTAISLTMTSTNGGSNVTYKIDTSAMERYLRLVTTPVAGTGTVGAVIVGHN